MTFRMSNFSRIEGIEKDTRVDRIGMGHSCFLSAPHFGQYLSAGFVRWPAVG
jgi:hypothetical protein